MAYTILNELGARQLKKRGEGDTARAQMRGSPEPGRPKQVGSPLDASDKEMARMERVRKLRATQKGYGRGEGGKLTQLQRHQAAEGEYAEGDVVRNNPRPKLPIPSSKDLGQRRRRPQSGPTTDPRVFRAVKRASADPRSDRT